MKLERYISPKYLLKQQWLHERPAGYGGRGDKWADAVHQLLKRYQCRSMLDYGCGQGKLVTALRYQYPHDPELTLHEYDPAFPKKADIGSSFYDLVVCTDVLEHVEPDRLAVVINHLFKLTSKALFLVIATRPSNKFFEDGRNVHLIIEPASWWRERIEHPLFVSVPPPSSPEVSRELVMLLERKHAES